MKADYHFHPNLHAKDPYPRIQRLWEAMEDSGINAFICTEHVYKNAPHAYRTLTDAQPQSSSVHVFPGAELISSEGKGIEIIAFAEEDWYDDHPQILQPLSMPFLDIISYLQQSNLHWFIPHPFLLGNPLKKLFASQKELITFLQTVPGVEMYNGCYLLLETFYRAMPIRWVHRTQADKLVRSVQLQKNEIHSPSHQFYAIGSDAHHPRDIGMYVDIPTDEHLSRTDAYRALVTNTNIETIHIPNQAFSLRHLLYTGWTTFSEFCMKREWRKYEYQHQVFAQKTA